MSQDQLSNLKQKINWYFPQYELVSRILFNSVKTASLIKTYLQYKIKVNIFQEIKALTWGESFCTF